MGSDYRVPFTKILEINPHSGADRLEVATVYGFQVVCQKGRYVPGDSVLYIPIDSVITPELEEVLFPEGSKIKLHNHRVRQIRIRGLASQGMLVDPNDLTKFVNPKYLKDEQDLSEILNIKKYEPPAPGFANTIRKDKQRNRRHENPNFHKYNGINNIKWFPLLFKEGDNVVIQEKLHGTNARASILPFTPNNFFKKILRFLGLAPQFEKCYGSNNVEISASSGYKGFYGEDIYGNTFKKIDVFSKLRPNETVFGEIIGPNIQKNYDYGLTEHKFILFDVKQLLPDGKQKWLGPDEVEAFAKERGFDFVPVLYRGPYNKVFTETLVKGNSNYCLTQKVKEGIVIKSRDEYDKEGNKTSVKWINEDYLDKEQTDFH